MVIRFDPVAYLMQQIIINLQQILSKCRKCMHFLLNFLMSRWYHAVYCNGINAEDIRLIPPIYDFYLCNINLEFQLALYLLFKYLYKHVHAWLLESKKRNNISKQKQMWAPHIRYLHTYIMISTFSLFLFKLSSSKNYLHRMAI